MVVQLTGKLVGTSHELRAAVGGLSERIISPRFCRQHANTNAKPCKSIHVKGRNNGMEETTLGKSRKSRVNSHLVRSLPSFLALLVSSTGGTNGRVKAPTR